MANRKKKVLPANVTPRKFTAAYLKLELHTPWEYIDTPKMFLTHHVGCCYTNVTQRTCSVAGHSLLSYVFNENYVKTLHRTVAQKLQTLDHCCEKCDRHARAHKRMFAPAKALRMLKKLAQCTQKLTEPARKKKRQIQKKMLFERQSREKCRSIPFLK